jgi:hypothetical protein
MRQETVMRWIVNILGVVTWVIVVIASILALGIIAGFATETYAQRKPRCINSACDQPCNPGARFVRHQGCKP